MNAFIMTNEQILELGFEALVDKLGPVGMIRFIHQFEAGTGNFTEDRQQWLGVSDVETLAKQIQQEEDNIEYTANILSPVLEQKSDDTDVYNPLVKVWSDLQESEGIVSGLVSEDVEMSDPPPFQIENQIQEFVVSVNG